MSTWGKLGKLKCGNLDVTFALFQGNGFLPPTGSWANEANMSTKATCCIGYVPNQTFPCHTAIPSMAYICKNRAITSQPLILHNCCKSKTFQRNLQQNVT